MSTRLGRRNLRCTRLGPHKGTGRTEGRLHTPPPGMCQLHPWRSRLPLRFASYKRSIRSSSKCIRCRRQDIARSGCTPRIAQHHHRTPHRLDRMGCRKWRSLLLHIAPFGYCMRHRWYRGSRRRSSRQSKGCQHQRNPNSPTRKGQTERTPNYFELVKNASRPLPFRQQASPLPDRH